MKSSHQKKQLGINCLPFDECYYSHCPVFNFLHRPTMRDLTDQEFEELLVEFSKP